jgi:large subunit ribosomal protein L25
VLLRSVTMHPYRPQVEHVDFQRVQKDRKLHMKVPLHFTNAEKSPGVKDQGGVVSHVVNEIDITCLPDDLPQFVEVDLGNLAVGNSIHARDLKLPNGVELSLGKAENPVVATVVVPQLITEEEEVAAVVSAAEVPTTEQAATPKEGEAGAEGKPGEKDKPAAKAGGEKPAADKADKKEKK